MHGDIVERKRKPPQKTRVHILKTRVRGAHPDDDIETMTFVDERTLKYYMNIPSNSDYVLPPLPPEVDPGDLEEIAVDIDPAQDQDVMLQIDRQRLENNLQDWVGLSWSVGNRWFRIIEDEIGRYTYPGTKDKRPERQWGIQSADAAGRVWKARTIIGADLRARLQDSAVHDLRFEIPIDRDHAITLAGRLTTAAATTARPPTQLQGAAETVDNAVESELTRGMMRELLNHRDLASSDPALTPLLEGQDEANRTSQRLQDMVGGLGAARVFELAEQLHQSYITNARRLELLEGDVNDQSISWALLELVSAYHSALQAGEDVFGGDSTSRNKLREVVNAKIGYLFATIALVRKPVVENIGYTQVGPEVKPVQRLVQKADFNPAAITRLQPFIKDPIKKGILQPVVSGAKEQLSRQDYVTIGELLNFSVGSKL
jgi:hypothetical protein